MAQSLPRAALPLVHEYLRTFRVVVVTGARQVGKSTLARALVEARRGTLVDLDDAQTLEAVLRDPNAVLSNLRGPVVIDEFQRAGDGLLRAVKQIVDRANRPGRFLLTGSTRFLTVPTLSESLAGRAGIVELWPLSQAEFLGRADVWIDRAFSGVDALRDLRPAPASRAAIAAAVCRGGYPEIRAASARARGRWVDAYLETVTQRDALEITRVHRPVELLRLARMLAARTAQELVVTDFARDLGLNRGTLENHLALLEALHLWHRVPAWSTNLTSKVAKHAKAHMVDSGIAAHLVGADAASLATGSHPALGPLLESFVAGELARQATWSSPRVTLQHFRDRSGTEIDFVLEASDGRVVAVEVKASAVVHGQDVRALELIRGRARDRFVQGVVLYQGEQTYPFGDRITVQPISALWGR